MSRQFGNKPINLWFEITIDCLLSLSNKTETIKRKPECTHPDIELNLMHSIRI